MVQSSLVGWWPLSEWSGRANDLSGNDNHASLIDSPVQGVAGKSGLTSFSFDGTDDAVRSTDYSRSAGGEVTVSFWIRSRSTDDFVFQERAGGSAATFVADNGAGGIYAAVNNDSGTRFTAQGNHNRSFGTNEWIHVCYTGSDIDSVVELYLDGELKDSVNFSGTLTDADRIEWGGVPSASFGFVEAEMADIRAYNRRLSPSEVQHLYEVGSVDVATPPNASDANAVSRWSFDDRSDTSTALDEWSSNDGTITGATYSADSIRGLSMSFDAVGENVNVGQGYDSANGTFSFWFNSRINPSDARFLLSDRGPSNEYIQFTYDQSINFRIFDGSGHSTDNTEAIPDNTWHHIVGTWGSDGMKFYRNGVLRGTNTSFTGSWNQTLDLLIGDDHDFVRLTDALMDDVRYYDRQLSDYEVQQLYLWGTRGVDRRHELIRK